MSAERPTTHIATSTVNDVFVRGKSLTRELIGHLARLVHGVAVEPLDHRHGEAGRAIAALRAVVLHHTLLYRVQFFSIRKSLCRYHLAPGTHDAYPAACEYIDKPYPAVPPLTNLRSTP